MIKICFPEQKIKRNKGNIFVTEIKRNEVMQFFVCLFGFFMEFYFYVKCCCKFLFWLHDIFFQIDYNVVLRLTLFA